METKDTIFESGIELVIGTKIADYDVECKDGEAIATICDDCLGEAPRKVRLQYPTLDEVLADPEKSEYVLKYRGLHDLTPSDIHYGDIMLAFGDVASIISEL